MVVITLCLILQRTLSPLSNTSTAPRLPCVINYRRLLHTHCMLDTQLGPVGTDLLPSKHEIALQRALQPLMRACCPAQHIRSLGDRRRPEQMIFPAYVGLRNGSPEP